MFKKFRYSVLAILILVMGFGVIGTAAADEGERPLRQRRGIRGEITAIEADMFTLERRAGSDTAVTIQIAINEETNFHIIDQEEVGLADFSVGDTVLVRGQRQEDEAILASLVLLQPEGDHLLGRIAAVYDDGLPLNGRDEQEITINVNPNTIVAMIGQELTWDGDPAGREVMEEGMIVAAFGTASEDGLSLDAHTLVSQRPQSQQHTAVGQITAVNTDTFTMTTNGGQDLTILVTDETRYRLPGIENPSLDDFAVDDEVVVLGQPDEDGKITARMVATVPENRPHGRPVGGEIASVNSDEISLTTLRGDDIIAITNTDTIFRIGPDNEALLSDFASGDKVVVFGTRDEAAGTLLATHVMKRK